MLSSCDPAKRAYDNLLSFTEYIENNSVSFSDEDWDNAEYEYSAIIDAIDAQAYTDEQRVEIGKLKGRCAMQFARHSINSTGKEFNDFLLEAEGFIESIIDEITEGDTELQ